MLSFVLSFPSPRCVFRSPGVAGEDNLNMNGDNVVSLMELTTLWWAMVA